MIIVDLIVLYIFVTFVESDVAVEVGCRKANSLRGQEDACTTSNSDSPGYVERRLL